MTKKNKVSAKRIGDATAFTLTAVVLSLAQYGYIKLDKDTQTYLHEIRDISVEGLRKLPEQGQDEIQEYLRNHIHIILDSIAGEQGQNGFLMSTTRGDAEEDKVTATSAILEKVLQNLADKGLLNKDTQ